MFPCEIGPLEDVHVVVRDEEEVFAGGLPDQRCEALRFKDGVSLVDVAHRRGEHGLRIGYEEEAVVHPGGEPGGEGAVHQGVEDSGVPGGRPDGDGKQRLQFLGVVERQECRGLGEPPAPVHDGVELAADQFAEDGGGIIQVLPQAAEVFGAEDEDGVGRDGPDQRMPLLEAACGHRLAGPFMVGVQLRDGVGDASGQQDDGRNEQYQRLLVHIRAIAQ